MYFYEKEEVRVSIPEQLLELIERSGPKGLDPVSIPLRQRGWLRVLQQQGQVIHLNGRWYRLVNQEEDAA